MTAVIGLFLRELGRLFAGSAATFALPLGLAWFYWQYFYGGLDTGAVDGADAVFRAASLVIGPLSVWAAAPALAAERAEGTATLWAISAVRPAQVLGGKFAAIMTFLIFAALVILGPALWQLAAAGAMAPERALAGGGGLLLLAALATSVTLLASALATHFSTAFVAGFGFLALWGWATDLLERLAIAAADLMPQVLSGWVASLFHPVSGWGGKAVLSPLFVGWVDLGAVCGLLAATFMGLLIAHQVVASEQWRG
ncbi:MAG: hypothetical protein ACE5FN_02965 [Leptospirillia bacterium]